MTKCDQTIDLEEAILERHTAEKRARAERRAAPKKSTSVLLPAHLRKQKNGYLVERIQTWLDSVDRMQLIENTLAHHLRAIQATRAALKGAPGSVDALFTGYQPIVFHAKGADMFAGSSDEMSEYKKTLTLPKDMHMQLIDVAVDLGTTLGEAVRIAVTHTYLVSNADGSISVGYEAGKPHKRGKDAVSEHRLNRARIKQQRIEQFGDA